MSRGPGRIQRRVLAELDRTTFPDGSPLRGYRVLTVTDLAAIVFHSDEAEASDGEKANMRRALASLVERGDVARIDGRMDWENVESRRELWSRPHYYSTRAALALPRPEHFIEMDPYIRSGVSDLVRNTGDTPSHLERYEQIKEMVASGVDIDEALAATRGAGEST